MKQKSQEAQTKKLKIQYSNLEGVNTEIVSEKTIELLKKGRYKFKILPNTSTKIENKLINGEK